MMTLQDKITAHFEGKVVRKDLTKLVKGNAVVPTYVLEYLLGQHCASFDEEVIQHGLQKVRDIISKHFVHRDEAEVVKSYIREKNNHTLIDKVSVRLNDKKDVYEAFFSNLGLNGIPLHDDYIKKHPKLLTAGVWCIVNMSYFFSDEKQAVPWVIESLKPIQIAHVDLAEYRELRKHFTTQEWIDLLLQSIGFNPEFFTLRDKLLQLARLIPFCENNYNLIELGPKGTGKSHIFSELSPHGILISGGEVTQAKLFVNNTSGKIGLVGFWDTVAFDEFAGKNKSVDKKLVDIMKNYMANKSFSRGRDVYGANASMVFIGNTDHSVAYMLKHTNLFDALPPGYYDTAFLDRIHYYLPGWEVKKLRNEMLTTSYGFIVDYLAEILRELRKEDFSHHYKDHFTFSDTLTTRDRTAIVKTLSGLIKIIYPNADCSADELKELLLFAAEGRKRVKNQLIKIDDTFEAVDFGLTHNHNHQYLPVYCLEEENLSFTPSSNDHTTPAASQVTNPDNNTAAPNLILTDHGRHIHIKENQQGISYKKLFAPYLVGAKHVHLIDPYLMKTYQLKNLMEFCQMLLEIIPDGEEMHLDVVTKYEEYDLIQQAKTIQTLANIKNAMEGTDLHFNYSFDLSSSFHARYIEADNGWKISLDRGLDVFQPYDWRNPFTLENIRQEARFCKAFEVTYLRFQ